jgi:hypothetical protein
LAEHGLPVPDVAFEEAREEADDVSADHDQQVHAVADFGQGSGHPAGILYHQDVAHEGVGVHVVDAGTGFVSQTHDGTHALDFGAETGD